MLLPLASLLFLLTINSVSPTTINSSDDVITISATASGLSNTQYLQAVFTKEGESSSNYFGFTKNLADEWYQYKSSPTDSDLSSYFYSFTPNSGTWSGQLVAKADVNDDGYKGPGNYILKLFKPTSSSVSRNYQTITINIPVNIPESTSVVSTIPDPSIEWEVGGSLEIGKPFKLLLKLKNLEKEKEFYLKVRGGVEENKLTKVQTKNGGSFLSDGEGWPGFPIIKIDGSGNWNGELWGMISEDKDGGKYKFRVRARKKDTESFYESDIKELSFNKVVDPIVIIATNSSATKTAIIAPKKSSPSAVLGSSVSAKVDIPAETKVIPKPKDNRPLIVVGIVGFSLLGISTLIFVKKRFGI